jgi:hypothetical protein
MRQAIDTAVVSMIETRFQSCRSSKKVHITLLRGYGHNCLTPSPSWSCGPAPAVAYQQPKQQAQKCNVGAKSQNVSITRALNCSVLESTGMTDCLPVQSLFQDMYRNLQPWL